MANTWFGKYVNFLGKFFTMGAYNGNIADEINKALKGAEGKYLGTNLTPAENEANEFSAQQAAIQRDWEAEQAELADQRTRQFYEDYQSYGAQVRQMQEAGLNPALMYGRGASPASPISGSQASGGASPVSVKPQSGDIGQLLSGLISLKFKSMEVEANKSLKEAQSGYYNALKTSVENNNSVFKEMYALDKELKESNIVNVKQETAYKLSLTILNEHNITKVDAETALLKAQELIASSDAKYRDDLNEALLALRKSEDKLNTQLMYESSAREDLYDQQFDFNEQTWDDHKGQIKEALRKMSADAGISEKEFEAFWTDKRLQAFAIQASAYEAYKGSFSVLFGLFKGEGLNPFHVGTGIAGSNILYPNE